VEGGEGRNVIILLISYADFVDRFVGDLIEKEGNHLQKVITHKNHRNVRLILEGKVIGEDVL